MNILGVFLNQEIRTGGHIRSLELFEELAKRGNRVTVLLNSDLVYKPKNFFSILLNASYKRNGFPPASYLFKRTVRSWALNKETSEKYDAILAFGETHRKAAIVLKYILEVPILFGLQSNSVREAYISLEVKKSNTIFLIRKMVEIIHYKFLERVINRECDGIVFQSVYDRDDFLSRNTNINGKYFIIGGNIGPPRFSEENRDLNHSNRMKKILFMGTLGERKGLYYLFDAFRVLFSEGWQELELHIAGPGTEAQRNRFESFAEEYGFLKKVTFYGRVPSTFPLMEACDIMITPSLFDSYPDVILLALHAGIPVIGSRTGGISEILSYKELLFPPGNSQAIADKLRRCLNEHDYYLKLRDYCNSRYKEFLFDWPAKWEEVLLKVIAR